jgi:hypothetical protein
MASRHESWRSAVRRGAPDRGGGSRQKGRKPFAADPLAPSGAASRRRQRSAKPCGRTTTCARRRSKLSPTRSKATTRSAGSRQPRASTASEPSAASRRAVAQRGRKTQDLRSLRPPRCRLREPGRARTARRAQVRRQDVDAAVTCRYSRPKKIHPARESGHPEPGAPSPEEGCGLSSAAHPAYPLAATLVWSRPSSWDPTLSGFESFISQRGRFHV